MHSLIVPLISGFGAGYSPSVLAPRWRVRPSTPTCPGRGSSAWVTTRQGCGTIAKVGVFMGLVVLLLAWYRVVVYLRRRPGTPVRTVLVVFALWVLPLLVAPPLFSQDAYSDVAQGTMVVESINPYHYGPETLTSTDPKVASLVAPIWERTAVPYGPYLSVLTRERSICPATMR